MLVNDNILHNQHQFMFLLGALDGRAYSFYDTKCSCNVNGGRVTWLSYRGMGSLGRYGC